MDQFLKMRKKMSLSESTRQVLNKSIDLLHKLSNNKIKRGEVKEQLSTLLTAYFKAVNKEKSDCDERGGKVRLEVFLDQVYEIVDNVKSGETPLYEAIMHMNKLVISQQPTKREEKEEDSIEEITENLGMLSEEFDLSGDQREKAMVESHETKPSSKTISITDLIDEVVRSKKQLEESVFLLNDSLHELGFELRALN